MVTATSPCPQNVRGRTTWHQWPVRDSVENAFTAATRGGRLRTASTQSRGGQTLCCVEQLQSTAVADKLPQAVGGDRVGARQGVRNREQLEDGGVDTPD